MRRLSASSPHELGGNYPFSWRPQETQDRQPSLPPIREALSFFYDEPPPPSSTAASSRAMSDPRRLSNSPRGAAESLADGHDNVTYTLSPELDRDPRLQLQCHANTGLERRQPGGERDDRFNQVPRGYQAMAYPPPSEQNGSPSGSYIDGTGSTASGVSSPPSSSVFSATAESEARSEPIHLHQHQHRRPGPPQGRPYAASTASSGWDQDRVPEPRRYTDYHYPPSGRPSLPDPPSYRIDEHLPPYSAGPPPPPPPPYAASGGPFQQHPSRTQPLSTSSIRSYDRAVFPPSTVPASSAGGSQYGSLRHQSRPSASASYQRPQEYYGNAEYRNRGPPSTHNSAALGGVANGRLGDSNQRKRRGNLPKETTDKLRAWFADHLHHPYPSEDEKQDLMQQTGLQMNQISNWFINARRRHLPALINNAKAVSGAMSSVHGSSTGGSGGMSGGMSAGIDSMRGNGGGPGSGPGNMRHKGFYTPADHNMYASPDRMYGSFDRSLEPRSTSLYRGDSRHFSPGSDDDY
ncbi:homeodomain super [Sporothrix curviconia]|uniref:Homeodomain super n=1 Tax=Sporothrix curviconia TaxID=1260050 RepID=A0ABP0B7R5_9PEZI